VTRDALLSRRVIHHELTSHGCRTTNEQFHGKSGHYRFWQAPSGLLFAVPSGDHVCPAWVLQAIIDAISAT
jgi:hypothetical protein